jgi:hypothetical protein
MFSIHDHKREYIWVKSPLLGWTKLNVTIHWPNGTSINLYKDHPSQPYKVCLTLTPTSTSSLYSLRRRNVLWRYPFHHDRCLQRSNSDPLSQSNLPLIHHCESSTLFSTSLDKLEFCYKQLGFSFGLNPSIL